MGIRTSLSSRCIGQIKDALGLAEGKKEKRERGRGHEWTESSAEQYLAAWTDKKGHNAEGRIDSPRSERITDEAVRLASRGKERATLLLKRCSATGYGKQRATGRLRSVINHFFLRKQRRAGVKTDEESPAKPDSQIPSRDRTELYVNRRSWNALTRKNRVHCLTRRQIYIYIYSRCARFISKIIASPTFRTCVLGIYKEAQ